MFSALLIALFACTGGDSADKLTGDATNGATVYADNCASCHGADGTGGSGPALQEIASEGATDEAEDYVRNGDGDMPAFEGTLTDQEIADVVAYVMTL